MDEALDHPHALSSGFQLRGLRIRLPRGELHDARRAHRCSRPGEAREDLEGQSERSPAAARAIVHAAAQQLTAARTKPLSRKTMSASQPDRPTCDRNAV